MPKHRGAFGARGWSNRAVPDPSSERGKSRAATSGDRGALSAGAGAASQHSVGSAAPQQPPLPPRELTEILSPPVLLHQRAGKKSHRALTETSLTNESIVPASTEGKSLKKYAKYQQSPQRHSTMGSPGLS